MERISRSVIKKLCSTSKEEVDYSFNIIFKKYRYLVYYVSFDILKNQEEAKDMVNETFLRMYDQRREFDSESKLKYFLLVTAKNLSLNRLKRIKIHLSYSDDLIGKYDTQSLSSYLSKFKGLIDKDEYKYLVLHLIYGFTFSEIADALKLTTSQVSSKYRRGISKLRTYYGGK